MARYVYDFQDGGRDIADLLGGRGGKTSHAAVVARGMGKVCVCGADELTVDTEARRCTTRAGAVVEEGTVISVDGSAGAVYLGAVPMADSEVMRFLETGDRPEGVVTAVARALERADTVRRLEVRANADTPEDADRARRFGAQGIGLCRTEHMFLGERRKLVEEMILASDEAERERALAALLPLQRQDFTGILEAMDDLPVTIRLLDPPLHEFLPDHTELAVRLAAAEARGEQPDPHEQALRRSLAAVPRGRRCGDGRRPARFGCGRRGAGRPRSGRAVRCGRCGHPADRAARRGGSAGRPARRGW
jgi:pyruvate,orthophosphate dikinase